MLAPCYLVHGGEPLQTEEIIASIRHLSAKEGYNKNVVFELNTLFDWEELLNKCQNFDLFAEHTLMELRLPGETVSKQGNEILEQILSQQDASLHIVIRANKLKPQTLNSNWVKHIQKNGKVYQAKSIPTAQWPVWLNKRLAQNGITLTTDALEFMAQSYEGNLFAAAQCIKKLLNIKASSALTLEQIKPFIESNNSFTTFELTNTVLNGNTTRVIRILDSLRAESVEPVLVLWSLTKEIRLLLALQHDKKHGVQIDQSAQRLGIWRESLPRYIKAADRLSTENLTNLLNMAQAIDNMIKGLQNGNVWEHLTTMCVSISGSEFLTTEDLCL